MQYPNRDFEYERVRTNHNFPTLWASWGTFMIRSFALILYGRKNTSLSRRETGEAPVGLEPTTSCLTGMRSNQLS